MTPERVLATSKPWNSATTLYIARALQDAANGRRLTVLDMGCGDGLLMRSFADLGHDLYGFDLPDREAALREKMGPVFGDRFDEHIRIMADERRIPFDDASFDVVYANQVFEHVRFLDQMVAETVRVLKPGGILIALFPLATYPVEGHCLVPFAHWLPPGRGRQHYLTAMLRLRIGRRFPGMTSRQSAVEWDDRLRQFTFYRFVNEITALFDHYYEGATVDAAGYIRAKIDLLQATGSWSGRLAASVAASTRGPLMDAMVTHGFMGVFVATNPRSAETRRRMLAWKT
ncbi:MAG TPA: class I SAM-dependent methyltransferase [Vicinamibacterales bacterium]|nr:class I SAM-dependent methyltransferase [Vicinamibacterales bacterium]